MMETLTYAAYCDALAQTGTPNEVVQDFAKLTQADESLIGEVLSELQPLLIRGDWFEGVSLADDGAFRLVSAAIFRRVHQPEVAA